MPRKPVIPAQLADSLTADKPPSSAVRAVSVLSGEPAPDSLADKDPETLAVEIIALQSRCGEAMLEIGKRLIAAKDKLPHGDWLPWLERVGMSKRLAQRFMQLAREWSNASTLTHLGMSKALALLALPESDRDAFIQEAHVVNGDLKTVQEMSSRELDDAIQARKNAEAELSSVQAQLAESQRRLTEAQADAETTLGKLKLAHNRLEIEQSEKEKALAERDAERNQRIAATDELFQLKQKPVDVAVETVVDQKAIDEAKQEVRFAMQSKLDAANDSRALAERNAKKLSEQLDSVQKTLSAAQKQSDEARTEAHNARQELESVRAEAERLRKSASLADSDLTLFAVLFEQVKQDAARMASILREHPDKKDSLQKTMSALADAFRKAAES